MANNELIQFSIESKEELIRSYLPFMAKGGIIVPSNVDHQIGDELSVELKLFDQEPVSFSGKVAWKTPAGTYLTNHNGVGVELSCENGVELRKRIEVYLSEANQG